MQRIELSKPLVVLSALALYIGFGNGVVHAFNPKKGKFLGAITSSNGSPVTIPGLWGLKVGNAAFGGSGSVIFSAGPMLSSLYLSFTKYDVVSAPEWVGIKNYLYLLRRDPAFWPSVKVTAVYAIVSVPLSLIVALLIALH